MLLDIREKEQVGIKSSIYFRIKRLLDVILCLLGLIILSPFMVVVGILIKIEDPKGPIFYAHSRIGKDGKKIPVYKYRSMYENADELKNNFTLEQQKEYAESFKLKDDPRITKIGNLLRKTSIDELPQLVNIIKGEMTLVGPRPIVDDELIKYGKNSVEYLSVKPGLTGMWQAYGRSDTTYEERVKLDVYYVNNQSLKLDIKILIQTVVGVIKREGAY